MDLRPDRCREMAEAIYDDMLTRGPIAGERGKVIEAWVELMVPLWTSYSIDVPLGYTSTDDDDVARQFLAKYPQLQALIDLCKTEALRRWPHATFELELHNSYDDCHCCREGQDITLKIQTDLDFYGPDGSFPEGSPYSAADDSWSDWTCGDSPYRLLYDSLGEVAHLFRSSIGYKSDDENGEE